MSVDALWDRWQEVDRLFEAALERPAEDRARFLADNCTGDRELHDVLLGLLAAEAASRGELDGAGVPLSLELVEELAAGRFRERVIGPYRILGELGRGGMGTVYLAEQEGDGFRRRVALKVLRRGIDTDDLLRRFVTERRILARLDHPNIARFYDGGATESGRPYLVMERVHGTPLTTYCDQRALPIAARLELLLQVADAVAAAHAQLIVHRDLKPSNVLVTDDGRVKLLDFGIAKLLDPEEGAQRTRTGRSLLTPDHASPEQLRGDQVTTATDVYQLGVLLLQLLAGTTPHRLSTLSPAATGRTAAPLEPVTPSQAVAAAEDAAVLARARSTTPRQLRAALRGDLDTIVGRALQPEPGRRYESASALAHDLRRHLDGRPIEARPDTILYRTGKYLRRHPWVAPTVAALVLGVVGYLVTISRYALRLEQERAAVQLEAERAQEVQRFLVELFAAADPHAPADPELGRRITVVDALDLGVEKLENQLRDRPRVRASILAAIADAYRSLGAIERGLPLAEEAYAVLRGLDDADSPEVRRSLALLADLLFEEGDLVRAEELHRRRLELALAAEPRDTEEIAEAHTRLGRLYLELRQLDRAEQELRAALELGRQTTLSLGRVAEATRSLADVQQSAGRIEESIATGRRALELKRAALGEESLGVALAQGTLAASLHAGRQLDEADELFRLAIEGLERTLGPDHAYVLATINNLAILRRNAGDHSRAEELLREVAEIAERRLGPGHPSLGTYLQNHAVALTALGRIDEARELHERAAEIFRTTLGETDFTRGMPPLSLAAIHLTQGRPEAAEAASREALGVLESSVPEGHHVLAIARCRLGRALAVQGRAEEAARQFALATPTLLASEDEAEHRRTCLEAAAEFWRTHGRPEQARVLTEAL